MEKELDAIVAVASERHFGKAADRLQMSQSQLSQLVRRAEDKAGFRIFDRRPHVALTEPGAVYVASATTALSEMKAGYERALRIARGSEGLVRVGFAPVAMLSHLPKILKNFRDLYPHVALELAEHHSGTLWKMLESGSIDLAITREPITGVGASNHLFHSEEIVVALPVGHPLALQPSVGLAELSAEEFIMFPADAAPQYHRNVVAACRSAGFEPKVTQLAASWSSILALVANGFGIALLSSSIMQMQYPNVAYVRITPSADLALFWLSWVANRESPAGARLRSMLLDAAQ